MHAVEIFNYESYVAGFESFDFNVYKDFLRDGKKVLCTANDDSHGTVFIGGGFTVVKADKLEYRTITSALLEGNFYSSSGPEIKELFIEDGLIKVTTSPTYKIAIHSGLRRVQVKRANLNSNITNAEFKFYPEDEYFIVIVTDSDNNKAVSNAYFTKDII